MDELEQGREQHRRRCWSDAYTSLTLADRTTPLQVEDLERLALAAYLTGRDAEYLKTLDRVYHAHLEAGEGVRACRCAFWLGLRLVFRGETGRATGWLGRAQRLLEGRDLCAEHGFLLLPLAEQQLGAGDPEAAHATAAEAARIGEQFVEADLVACARHLQGRARISQGQVEAGLALLDEVMLAVIAGELSPLVTGLMYCSVIESCQEVYALGRAREWTAALAEWCDAQPDMVTFTGTCRVHRAEIMQLHGAWPEAIAEARRARERAEGTSPRAVAAAFYRQGELHRLRGETAAAEEAYRAASEAGLEPQPGLALLWLAQGRIDAAAGAIRRAVNATANPLLRARLLPAHIEIALCAGDPEEARVACAELEALAERSAADMVRALAAHARGAIELAAGEALAALAPLRLACQLWHRLEVPYETARTHVSLGLACRALGDHDGGALELDAARATLERLGAAPDLANLETLVRGRPAERPCGLSARELQVLRLVATGKTNKVIARELFLAEKTIDRHVSNIFTKLAVSSRAAATAYAYEHKLI